MIETDLVVTVWFKDKKVPKMKCLYSLQDLDSKSINIRKLVRKLPTDMNDHIYKVLGLFPSTIKRVTISLSSKIETIKRQF